MRCNTHSSKSPKCLFVATKWVKNLVFVFCFLKVKVVRSKESPFWIPNLHFLGSCTSKKLNSGYGKLPAITQEKEVKNGKCRRKWGKIYKKMRKEGRKWGKIKKKRRKMRNVNGKSNNCYETTETFLGSTKMEISPRKRLKSCREKWICLPPPMKTFPVTSLPMW